MISEAFQKAAGKCVEVLDTMVKPLELSDRESLLKSASTSLNSKVSACCSRTENHSVLQMIISHRPVLKYSEEDIYYDGEGPNSTAVYFLGRKLIFTIVTGCFYLLSYTIFAAIHYFLLLVFSLCYPL